MCVHPLPHAAASSWRQQTLQWCARVDVMMMTVRLRNIPLAFSFACVKLTSSGGGGGGGDE
jgi:hypothetical protein